MNGDEPRYNYAAENGTGLNRQRNFVAELAGQIQ